eukprot:Skav209483  [mRNA]  locus=scaffold1892:114718:134983:+ [translate_table: standard]
MSCGCGILGGSAVDRVPPDIALQCASFSREKWSLARKRIEEAAKGISPEPQSRKAEEAKKHRQRQRQRSRNFRHFAVLGPECAQNEDFGASPPKLRRSKTVEQTYQKKTQAQQFPLPGATGEMEYRDISYVPALYKVFDEILVNAADNLQRDSKMKARSALETSPDRKTDRTTSYHLTISSIFEPSGRVQWNSNRFAKAQSKMTLMMDKNISKASHGKRVLGVPKLEDANEAGLENPEDCTLILTEGDSAKALAVAGLAVLGRDKFGVFPLRGKLLNVRELNQKSLAENKEAAMNIVKILGLSFDKKKTADLRYGKVMIMADQDYDGSHIKGLLINFFHYFWPDLLRGKQNFLQQFITPIVKATKDGQVKQFYTMVEYEKWKKKSKDGAGWKIKYYKGLGTSTAAEAKEYFSKIQDHRIEFRRRFREWKGTSDNKLIDMAFNKGRADDRKTWMNKYQAPKCNKLEQLEEGTFVDHSKRAVSYEDFILKLHNLGTPGHNLGAKVREYHTERQVHFVVRMEGNKLKEAEQKDGIEVALKLKGSINETNMVLFNHEGKITKYKNAKEIMQEFAKVRLKMGSGDDMEVDMKRPASALSSKLWKGATGKGGKGAAVWRRRAVDLGSAESSRRSRWRKETSSLVMSRFE